MVLGVGAAVANAVVVALGCVGAVGVGLALVRWARAGYAAAGRRARMRGQVAIITGGSSGIGLAIARRLVERGMKVVLAARGETQLSTAVKELTALGGDVHAVPTDISSEQACKAMVQAALDRHGRLDLVVACAGIGHHGLASKDTRELQLSLLEVLLRRRRVRLPVCVLLRGLAPAGCEQARRRADTSNVPGARVVLLRVGEPPWHREHDPGRAARAAPVRGRAAGHELRVGRRRLPSALRLLRVSINIPPPSPRSLSPGCLEAQ
jgi:hypothetical protein|eukprot:SAG25_NODE_1694_length_2531_cov_3.553270_3_plen_266_part_00